MSIPFGGKAIHLIITIHMQSKFVFGKSKTGKIPWSSSMSDWHLICQYIFWDVFIPDSKELLLNSSQGSFQKDLEEVSLVETRVMDTSRSKKNCS